MGKLEGKVAVITGGSGGMAIRVNVLSAGPIATPMQDGGRAVSRLG